jgi:hypothetical protein
LAPFGGIFSFNSFAVNKSVEKSSTNLVEFIRQTLLSGLKTTFLTPKMLRIARHLPRACRPMPINGQRQLAIASPGAGRTDQVERMMWVNCHARH